MTEQIVFESSADQAGWVQMPNVVLMDETLSMAARLLYAMLVHYARQEGACYPGQQRLAAKLGVTDRSVRQYVAELERSMLVRRESRGTARACRYVLLSLDLRAKRLAGNATPEEDFRRNVASDDAGSLLPAEVEAGEADAEVERARTPGRVKISGKPVNADSWTLTAKVLEAFNAAAGKKLRLLTSAGQPSEAAKRIYGRVRVYPDITAAEHADIIRRTLKSKWWGSGPPSIGVVYGPRVFEDNITRGLDSRAARDPNRFKRTRSVEED